MRTNAQFPTKLDGLGIFALIAEALTFPPTGTGVREGRRLGIAVGPAPAPRRRQGTRRRLGDWLSARGAELERTVSRPYY